MTTDARRAEPDPFLDQDPPPWAARALGTILLVLFAAGIAGLVVVRVPETVSATFVLEPVRGADPVRTLHDGVVSRVTVEEAQAVERGAVLFVVASEPAGDRMAERQALDVRLSGEGGRLVNERQMYENQRRADEQERQRLEQRLSNLERQLSLKQQQATLAQDLAARQRKSFDEGVATWMEATKQKLEADRLEVDVEEMRTDLADTGNALKRLAFEMASRRAAFAELQRGIGEEMSAQRARKGMMDQDTSRQGNAMSVEAPCAGTVVKLHIRNPGAVVHEGDTLAEVVCAGERLQAELLLPERGMALVRIGQPVKLLYDAFPYQRYGVHYGTLRWLSPASTVGPRGAAFRAFAALDNDSVGVQGQRRPVLPGMSGRAAVIVGRRSLASYAFEPLRQIRESLATGPGAAR